MRPYKDPDEFMKTWEQRSLKSGSRRLETAFYEIDVLKAGFDMEDPEQKTAFTIRRRASCLNLARRWSG